MTCSPPPRIEASSFEVAQLAYDINPANRPPIEQILGLINNATQNDAMPIAEYISMVASKWFGSEGVDLTVGFMEPTAQELIDKIISYMSGWREKAGANVHFRYSRTDPQVRISRGAGGYYSYLGTDNLLIPASRQTMNLEGFTLNTPDSEYARVVYHETGHLLGCPHEHMRPELVALLDPAKTIQYFRRTQGWSKRVTLEQVLTPLDTSDLVAGPLEETSIMCYQLPGEITKSGKPILGGSDITAADAAFMRKQYPLTATPEPDESGEWTRYELNGHTFEVRQVT